MALRTVTVKTTGGDYTSLSAAEAGEQADMVALDRQLGIECYAMSDTTAVLVSGSVTDATRYIRIYTPSTERHDGKWNTAKYRLEPVDAAVITVDDEYVRFEGLQIRVDTPTATRNEFTMQFVGATSDVQMDSCIIRGSGVNSVGIGTSGNSGHLKVRNTLIYDCTNEFFGGIRWGGDGLLTGYNNTIVGCYYGVRKSGGTVKLVNTLVSGPTSGSAYVLDAGGWEAGTDYNASSTASATGGANDRVSQTFTFVDAAGKDFHLASTDAGAKDFGTDLSADATWPFSTDIDGQTRSGSWDIGADEVATAATGQPYVKRFGSVPFISRNIGVW